MKIWLFLVYINLGSVWADTQRCPVPKEINNSPLNDCISNVLNVTEKMTDNSLEETKSASSKFLSTYKDRLDFEVKPALTIIENLKKHARSKELTAQEQSSLWLSAAGIHGRISDKLKADGGVEHGKLAIAYIKTSLTLNPQNKIASISYGKTIAAFAQRDFIVRTLIQKGLQINLNKEVEAAKKAMEENGTTNEPSYQILKKY